MPSDRYRNFDDLRRHEREGIDFRICVAQRGTSVAVIAPHGGKIEPATSEITAAIAGALYDSYCFEGLRSRPHHHLHITSTRFDEPQCLGLISTCDLVVAVHGLSGTREAVDVGGLDDELRDLIDEKLKAAGFDSKVVTRGSHAARSKSNICNKGRRKAGVQLELTKALRDAFMQGPRSRKLADFADAVGAAITAAVIPAERRESRNP
jgi:phage replication-related protein YjqB (UPF0714/DUF867 family)